ncbi:uncharacterized protein PGTG_07647 [Puccinia graminis f. sp. tritici CRL 75-36-700-3]|uniref:Uncharacterized protein n=1 Tax=Puccinia graminis f. sp. tritici (strain CRL 75-36-700-3 / race SCCL) TaxID=418459 RepID=E3KCW4_PUCGT|nr:uncharacterized protein PGTG_07647 [Puccinia graminis f. sp. tritici CRL 75-36-700-3]EFP82250.2 hypothetical protein PGTG_07647 [Puccinia graminis f. sp. tritici CRL 75-36-700-3]
MLPPQIWLSFKNKLVTVQTKELVYVINLAQAAKTEFPSSLRDFDTPDITLHTSEDAEALTSDSALAEIAPELSLCAASKTPLIVKVKLDVAPQTRLIAKGIPAIIWLSFKGNLVSVETKGLVFVNQLAKAARDEFPSSLGGFDTPDITLHTTEDAVALTSDSALAEIAAELSPCAVSKTPLIVKASKFIPDLHLHVHAEIIRFWKALPEATLVTNGEVQYLELKEGYVLGDKKLGSRFLVRPVYKELYDYIVDFNYSKVVVTGTPGIGKTIFSAYYMWIAACNQKTVVWEPCPSRKGGRATFLMTSGGVQRVNIDSHEVGEILVNDETVYIVDGQPPTKCEAQTLVVTSPLGENYVQYLKTSGTKLLYMPPWTYEELRNCKTIIYPDDQILPTALMDRLFEWYGGVPRYVVDLASVEFEKHGNEDEVVRDLVRNLTQAVYKGQVTDIKKAHDSGTREGEYSHRVLHICSHPSGRVNEFCVRFASLRVAQAVIERIEEELRTDLQNFLRTCSDSSGLRGLLFEPYTFKMLREGGRFPVRRLCKQDTPNEQDVSVEFAATERRTFRSYEEVDLRTNVFWQPVSKQLPSIDSLLGPANFFQATVSKTHPIKHQGLSKALELVDESECRPKLYFVVPSEIYPTYKSQPYHTKCGKVFMGNLGGVGKVEQWVLMIPMGGEWPVREEE